MFEKINVLFSKCIFYVVSFDLSNEKTLQMLMKIDELNIKKPMNYIFYEQLGSGLSSQSCLYFQGFWASGLLNGCLVV